MCNQCREQELELLPEFEEMFNELFPELEFELIPEIDSATRNSPDYIKWLQTSLNQVLGLRLATDGRIGPLTRSAIRSFQMKNGLVADGIAGAKTEAALKAAVGFPAQPVTAPPAPAQPVTSVRKMVDPKKVSCLTSPYRDAILRRIGVSDPLTVIEAASHRAVAMLSNTISEMTRIKERVKAGDPLAFPLLSDILAWSLKTRMLMKVEDRTA